MSEALTVIDPIPDYLPIPKGTTRRQFKIAKALLDPYSDEKTRAELMLEAGYAKTTAYAQASKVLDAIGTQRAIAAIQRQQADSARGLSSIGKLALNDAAADLKELEPRDRIAAGFKAYELAASLGENIEATGNGNAWKQRLRRACRLMARLTEARLRRPQDVVVSPHS